jgi:hypothetical protein
MAKREDESQIGSLTPNHGKSGIDPISLRVGGMRHVVEKFSTRAITSLQTPSWSEVYKRSYSLTKSREFQPWRFRDSRDKKNHLDEGALERCRVYYMGEGGGFPRVRTMVSLVSPKSPMAHLSTRVLQHCVNQLVGWFGTGFHEWIVACHSS